MLIKHAKYKYQKRFCLLLIFCLLGVTACNHTDNTDNAANPDASSSVPSEPSEPDDLSEPEPVPDPAEVYADSLTTEEQAAQLFFVRCPETNAAELAGTYNIGGYILFGRDFTGQTKESVQEIISSYQSAVKTPLLIGVDEEGGTVVRVSSNPAFRERAFRSPHALYQEGGIERILQDTTEKDALLSSIGINVNFAPVCDYSTDQNAFIYTRTLGSTLEETTQYISQTVEQMTQDHMGMVLKHFPGYGDNEDTHTGIATDTRPLEQFRTVDFLPFQAGIDHGAQAVLVSHTIVNCMDKKQPASLSPAVHQILRDELHFNGVILTDDLMMDAITTYTNGTDAAVLAVQAGNDMLLSSDFDTQYAAVLAALENGTLSEQQIREAAVRVIQWKMQLGLL